MKQAWTRPELKRLNAEDIPDDIKAGFADKSEADAPKFSPTFDVRIFSTVCREIFIMTLNRRGLVNTAEHFWEAQSDVNLLRKKLETAYRSGIQKAQNQKKQEFTELWMFGYLAYQRITEDGLSLKAFLEMPYARMERQAAELGAALIEKAKTDGEGIYLFEKKSREKE